MQTGAAFIQDRVGWVATWRDCHIQPAGIARVRRDHEHADSCSSYQDAVGWVATWRDCHVQPASIARVRWDQEDADRCSFYPGSGRLGCNLAGLARPACSQLRGEMR